MARKPAKSVPGTERFRDENRKEGGPRMHGRQWHDHEEAHDLEPEVMAAPDAVLEAEGSGERTGMGARRTEARATQSRERRKRSVPPGKGPKQKPGAGKSVKSRARGSKRA